MANIASVMCELFKMGKEVRLAVTGGSMYPFLREGQDSVTLANAQSYAPRVGDIVLIRRDNGQYVLHRVVKVSHLLSDLRAKEEAFYLLGDAQTRIEGPLSKKCILAVVTSVCRNGKIININSVLWRFLSFVWILLRPMRAIIINAYIKIFHFKVKQ